jgi:hypothetical protein
VVAVRAGVTRASATFGEIRRRVPLADDLRAFRAPWKGPRRTRGKLGENFTGLWRIPVVERRLGEMMKGTAGKGRPQKGGIRHNPPKSETSLASGGIRRTPPEAKLNLFSQGIEALARINIKEQPGLAATRLQSLDSQGIDKGGSRRDPP